jgi:hypothetical protein
MNRNKLEQCHIVIVDVEKKKLFLVENYYTQPHIFRI